jgi:hypothetical protein
VTAYRWNDPARTLPRRRLADRIRAEVGPETDSWDLPEPGTGRSLQPCGTPAAYERHLYRNEKPCEPCLASRRRGRNRQPGRSVLAGRLDAIARMRFHDGGPNPLPDTITTAEAAEELGVDRRTILRYKRRVRAQEEMAS